MVDDAVSADNNVQPCPVPPASVASSIKRSVGSRNPSYVHRLLQLFYSMLLTIKSSNRRPFAGKLCPFSLTVPFVPGVVLICITCPVRRCRPSRQSF